MYYSTRLADLQASQNLRQLPEHSANQPLIDLSGNDYLGITSNYTLREQFLSSYASNIPAFSASASRLLGADQLENQRLEALLNDYYEGGHTLLFNSGYHANVGAIAALSQAPILILADKLVHASIIDGMMLGRRPFQRFRHNDVKHLHTLLTRRSADYEAVLIVIESVYSMDGDFAPLDEIIALKRRFPNLLIYCDEAHALGVCGPQGLGLARLHPEIDFVVGTLGKAVGSMGAYVMCRTAEMRNYLINSARSLIFSTCLPPVNVAWSRFILEQIPSMEAERAQLQEVSQYLANLLGCTQASHIRPLITGSSESALALSAHLKEHGFKVLPIRTPTVPPGTERLRFSLSASLSITQLAPLKCALQS